MNVYYLDRASSGDYSDAFITATWSAISVPHSDGVQCPECKLGLELLVPPFRLEDGGDPVTEVADFAWGFFYWCVVTEQCAEKLDSAGLSLDFIPVDVPQMVKDHEGRLHKNIFAGRSMYVMRAKGQAHLDPIASGLTPQVPCSTCHRISYGNPVKRTGLVVARIEPPSSNCFHVIGSNPLIIFVTEEARSKILPLKLTNLEFKLAGKLL
jgi:hypothetical protein